MSTIFKFMFDRLTDPLGLPISALYEYIILALLGAAACGLAYWKVGKLYRSGELFGKTSGSLYHWVFRALFFVLLWLAAYCAIRGYYFVTANWQVILMIAGGVAGVAAVCVGVVAIMRLVKKHRTVNGNA